MGFRELAERLIRLRSHAAEDGRIAHKALARVCIQAAHICREYAIRGRRGFDAALSPELTGETAHDEKVLQFTWLAAVRLLPPHSIPPRFGDVHITPISPCVELHRANTNPKCWREIMEDHICALLAYAELAGENEPAAAPASAPAPQLTPLVVDVPGFAELMGVSRRHIERLESCGALPPSVTVGAARRWSVEAVQEWLRLGCPDKARFVAARNPQTRRAM